MDKRKEKFIFPAVFDPCEEGGYCITFPNLPGCITQGGDIDDALYMAKDALELHLWGMEDDGDPIPEPTPPETIQAPKGGFVTLIQAWMPPVRDEMANKAIKKTLTIPKWLNDLAEQERINFSHELQIALKNRLGIIDRPRNVTKQP
ncbi:pilus assembly protein HicB [Clostridiales bacterium PH28_bin88]|nr:pilus assembly protein HicB [Clostridiales bacterium PH28_bin88]